MNWLDILLIIVLLVFVILGFRQGIIRGALLLAGMVIGALVAGYFYIDLGDWLPISNTTTARIVAFLIIFGIILILAMIAAFMLRKAATALKLGFLDKLLGALFGFVAGAVITGVVLALLAHFFNVESTIGESWVASMLLERVPAVLALLPEEFDSVREWFR